jgi:hypothetical protein
MRQVLRHGDLFVGGRREVLDVLKEDGRAPDLRRLAVTIVVKDGKLHAKVLETRGYLIRNTFLSPSANSRPR